MPPVTLRQAVASGVLPTQAELVRLASALAKAMTAVHMSGTVVTALDADSVVLDGPGAVRVRPMPATASSWMAPERRGGLDSGIVGDSFLWGACVAYAATGQEPVGGTGPLPPSMEPLASLVVRALSPVPAVRPTFDEINGTLGSGSARARESSTRQRNLIFIGVGAVIAALLGVAGAVVLAGGSSMDEDSSTATVVIATPPASSQPPTIASSTPGTEPPASPEPSGTADIDVDLEVGPVPPPGTGVVAPGGTSFFESSSGLVRCAYFPEGTAGQVIACIDDESDTLVRLNAGMIRVTEVTASQSGQVPRIGVELGPRDSAWLYGTRGDGRPLFECWGVDGGIACREKAKDDWFVMGSDDLKTS